MRYTNLAHLGAIACLSSLLYINTTSTTAGQDKALNPLVTDTLKGLERRNQQLEPIYVKYKITRIETPAWALATEPKGKKEPVGEKKIVHEAEYAKKGNSRRSFARQIEPPVLTEWAREGFWIFNGEVAVRKSNRPNEYLLSKKPVVNLMAPTIEELTHETELLVLLREANSGSSSVLVNATEDTKGIETRRFLHITHPKSKWTNKATLLPQREFSTVRHEIRNEKNSLVDVVDIDKYENFSGITLPMVISQKHFLVDGKLGYSVQLEVTRVALEDSGVPDDLFRFDFPPESHLFDEDLGVAVRKAELAESHLKEIADRLAPPSLWQRWRVIIIAIFVPLLFTVIRWRIRLRVAKSTT